MEITTEDFINLMDRINELERTVNKSKFSEGLEGQIVELKKALKSILETQSNGFYSDGYFRKTFTSMKADEIKRLEKLIAD